MLALISLPNLQFVHISTSYISLIGQCLNRVNERRIMDQRTRQRLPVLWRRTYQCLGEGRGPRVRWQLMRFDLSPGSLAVSEDLDLLAKVTPGLEDWCSVMDGNSIEGRWRSR